MYSDQIDSTVKRSINERLNSNSITDSNRRRQSGGKRQREADDKWEHDLYQDNSNNVSRVSMDARDLRLKLQRKSLQQCAGGSLSGVRDLREKLSGIVSQPGTGANTAARPARKSVIVEVSKPEVKKVASQAARKKTQQKADAAIDNFLSSLGLEKYLITFQAEEVDMTALVHMKDEDLKVMGIPMLFLFMYDAIFSAHLLLMGFDFELLLFLIIGAKKEDTFSTGIWDLITGNHCRFFPKKHEF
ncbi:hypothetical protein ACFE04_029355 [Oxalis oulophora]